MTKREAKRVITIAWATVMTCDLADAAISDDATEADICRLTEAQEELSDELFRRYPEVASSDGAPE